MQLAELPGGAPSGAHLRAWWPMALCTAGILLVLGLITLVTALFFGNPQWNKYIYLFQEHVLKRGLDGPKDDYTGTWRTWHANGQQESESFYVTGNLTGVRRAWYPTGQLAACGKFQNDEPHGVWSYFHENGNRAAELAYNKGMREGIWTEWDKDGTIHNRSEYRGDKPWDGLCYLREGKAWQGFYRDGQPWTGYLPTLDKTTGKTEWLFYDNGRQVTEEEYGRLHKRQP